MLSWTEEHIARLTSGLCAGQGGFKDNHGVVFNRLSVRFCNQVVKSVFSLRCFAVFVFFIKIEKLYKKHRVRHFVLTNNLIFSVNLSN